MRIGIIGSGNIGGTMARLLEAAGHDVQVANSRGEPHTAEEAARFADVVLIAIPLHAVGDLPAEAFDGKIVIDANNYYAGRDGQVPRLDDGEITSSQLVQETLPGATVVKAFNSMNFRPLGSEGKPEAPRDERLAIFLAGDDDAAKGTVSELIEQLGFAPVDTGSLADSHRQEPGSAVYNQPMTAPEAERTLRSA
jgi:8-hydroxy-5-deazaflavin:NADPH oxidoreductase